MLHKELLIIFLETLRNCPKKGEADRWRCVGEEKDIMNKQKHNRE